MQRDRLIFILISILLISLIKTTAQTTPSSNNGWQWQYPKPQGNTLRDIFVFNQNTAIAVGDLGTVIKTYDGGENWDVQHHAGGTDIDLYSVHFTDTLNGWAAGGIWFTNKNVLLKTGNGGKTWTEIKTDTTLPYNSVYFVNVDTGFVFGEDGIILRTTDGGNSWSTRSIDSYLGRYLDVFRFLAVTFTDKQTGFLVGGGYYGNEIYKTTNCGRTWRWSEQIILPKIYTGLYDISFINKDNGFIVGDAGVFLKTTDGGTTWKYLNLWEKYQKDEYQYFYSTFFTDSLTGWIVGGSYYAFILKTTDGGENWIEEANNNDEMIHHFYKIRFSDRNNGWLMGQFGMIYKTADAGENWTSQRENNYHFNSIYFVNENTGWAVGDNGIILNTTDGGTKWFKQNQNDSLSFSSVYAIDNQNIFAVGVVIKGNWPAYTSDGIILRSSDVGQNWTRKTFDTLSVFNSIVFINDSTGWIAGSGLLKTNDRGITWNKITSDTNLPTKEIQFINEKIGWGSYTGGGVLLKTVDGGKKWNKQLIDSSFSMYSFHFINTNMGWAVGDINQERKNIYSTMDGGEHWAPCSNTPISGYNSVHFFNDNVGWAAGGYRIEGQLKSSIIKTTDGGNSWIDQQGPSSDGLSKLYFINENTGWAVGDGIFKTTTGGVSGIDDKPGSSSFIPKEIELYQNYPNPFNPSTFIEYHLNKNQHVKLQVFNILGKEIELLADQIQNAGYYKISWNPGKAASGVYFYRLITATEVITKKMLFIR